MCPPSQNILDLSREYADGVKSIPRPILLASVEHYEIIEEYPMDKYLPSYLAYSTYENKVFHVLFAVDIEEDHVRVITAYYPSLDEWEGDFKTRRR